MTLSKLVRAGAVGAAVALAAACSPSTPAAGDSVKLTLWSWRTEDVAAYNKILKSFTAKNPGISVEFKAYKNEYNTILQTGLTQAGGTAQVFYNKKVVQANGISVPTGLGNFIDLLTHYPQNTQLGRAFAHNVLFFAGTMAVQNTLGLLFAVLLHRNRAVKRFFQTAFLNPTFGPVNQLLRTIGLDSLALPWLGDPATALPTGRRRGSRSGASRCPCSRLPSARSPCSPLSATSTSSPSCTRWVARAVVGAGRADVHLHLRYVAARHALPAPQGGAAVVSVRAQEAPASASAVAVPTGKRSDPGLRRSRSRARAAGAATQVLLWGYAAIALLPVLLGTAVSVLAAYFLSGLMLPIRLRILPTLRRLPTSTGRATSSSSSR